MSSQIEHALLVLGETLEKFLVKNDTAITNKQKFKQFVSESFSGHFDQPCLEDSKNYKNDRNGQIDGENETSDWVISDDMMAEEIWQNYCREMMETINIDQPCEKNKDAENDENATNNWTRSDDMMEEEIWQNYCRDIKNGSCPILKNEDNQEKNEIVCQDDEDGWRQTRSLKGKNKGRKKMAKSVELDVATEGVKVYNRFSLLAPHEDENEEPIQKTTKSWADQMEEHECA